MSFNGVDRILKERYYHWGEDSGVLALTQALVLPMYPADPALSISRLEDARVRGVAITHTSYGKAGEAEATRNVSLYPEASEKVKLSS